MTRANAMIVQYICYYWCISFSKRSAEFHHLDNLTCCSFICIRNLCAHIYKQKTQQSYRQLLVYTQNSSSTRELVFVALEHEFINTSTSAELYGLYSVIIWDNLSPWAVILQKSLILSLASKLALLLLEIWVPIVQCSLVLDCCLQLWLYRVYFHFPFVSINFYFIFLFSPFISHSHCHPIYTQKRIQNMQCMREKSYLSALGTHIYTQRP